MLALTGSAPSSAPDSSVALAPPPIADAIWPTGCAQALARDAALFGEGDPARSWYRLLSGSVRVFRVLRDGRRHIGEFVFPGQFFGFEQGAVHLQGAEAIEPASVVVYSLERIEQRMAQDPAARHAMRQLLMERLAAAQERVMTLGRLNASGRLAAFLLVMAQRGAKGAGRGLVAELPMSRVDLADYLGLTVETVSRLFTALRGRRAIRLSSANHVEILDPAALESAAGGTVAGGSDAQRRAA